MWTKNLGDKVALVFDNGWLAIQRIRFLKNKNKTGGSLFKGWTVFNFALHSMVARGVSLKQELLSELL